MPLGRHSVSGDACIVDDSMVDFRLYFLEIDVLKCTILKLFLYIK